MQRTEECSCYRFGNWQFGNWHPHRVIDVFVVYRLVTRLSNSDQSAKLAQNRLLPSRQLANEERPSGLERGSYSHQLQRLLRSLAERRILRGGLKWGDS